MGGKSAPHRLAKILAKPLSNRLGSISSAHLKNSGDLINRFKDMDVKGKKMVSFDVRALFTNVPVDGAMAAASRTLTNASDEDLPVLKEDLLKLVSLRVSFNGFTFEDNEYQQINGLAMGSPHTTLMCHVSSRILTMSNQ